MMNDREQFAWLREQEHRDPHWARTEEEIRRTALRISEDVLRPRIGERPTEVHLLLPSRNGYGGFQSRIVRFGDVAQVGGYEQVLLIEEVIRRVMRDG